jgi:F0F1-type ATP synthase membrane subunit a
MLGDYFIILHYVPFIILFILTILELVVAFIQTYIFVTLSYFYLRDLFVGH